MTQIVHLFKFGNLYCEAENISEHSPFTFWLDFFPNNFRQNQFVQKLPSNVGKIYLFEIVQDPWRELYPNTVGIFNFFATFSELAIF